MANAQVKQEPTHGTRQRQPHSPPAAQRTANATQRNSLRRSMSIHSITSPVTETATLGASDTTLQDDDVEMNGTQGENRTQNGNGDISRDVESETAGAPTPDDAMQQLGGQARQLIRVIQKLELLGIDATLPSLPKFIVVGDQSAGKSSIIEAICGIDVPRDQGTCTRCPFHVVTSACRNGDGSRWQCRVRLHRRFQYTPNTKAGRGPGYDGWTEVELQPFDFAFVHDKSELQEVLRRAQAATLNPHMDPAYYVNTPWHHDMPKKVGFSPNVVKLDITGPELPELSFFDLPGAINVHAEGQDNLVVLVEKLIRNYLRDDKSLVLLACAADQDVDNSTAFRFVTQCKARDRCIGVLTKPDLVNKARMPLLRRILNGETFQLGGSSGPGSAWFITKQLSQEELDQDLTHADARGLEERFFGTEPWSSFASAARFGIPNLQAALSRKLTEQILKELPEINTRVHHRLAEVVSELAKFSEQPPPGMAPYAVIEVVSTICAEIKRQLTGEAERDEDFRPRWKKVMRALRNALQEARPRIKLQTPGYEKPTLGAISIDEDEDEAMDTPTPARSFATPSKARKLNNGQPVRTPQSRRTAEVAPRHVKAAPENEDDVAGRAEYDLEQISIAFDRGNNSLEDEINPKVKDQFVKDSVASWPALVNAFLTKIRALLCRMMETAIDSKLANRRQTELYACMMRAMENFIAEHLINPNGMVSHIVACEVHKPITYNQLLSQQKRAAETQLLRARLIKRANEHYDQIDAASNGRVKVPHGADREKKINDGTVEREIVPDPYDRVIRAMATPLGYYDIASASMLDSIAKHLEFALLHQIEKDVLQALHRELKVTDEQHCVRLLAQDPEQEARRKQLLAEQGKLQTAMADLESLPARSGSF